MLLTAKFIEAMGENSSPVRCVKALREGRATLEQIEAWLREKHLPGWQKVISEWQRGQLFKAQGMSWSVWSTEQYDLFTRQRETRIFYERVWHLAFCSSEEKSTAYKQIEAFVKLRVDPRCHSEYIPPALAKLDNHGLELARRWFAETNERYSWIWS